MARPLYIEFPNAFYHIAARGINRQALFLDMEDNNVFIAILRKVVFQFNLKLFAFCLMTNHYHLYFSTPDANLAKAIKALNQRYAIYFLAKYQDKDGTVFKGRYMRRLVDDQNYSLNLIAYVHNNPKDLVCKIEDWKYSSFPSFIGLSERFDFIDYDWVLSQFGNSLSSLVEFHDYMRRINWNPDDHTIAKTFIGTWDFVDRIKQQYLDLSQINEEEVLGIKELKRNFSERKLDEVLANLSKRNRLKVEIYLRREYLCESLKSLASIYQMTPKNISLISQRFKKLLKNDHVTSEEFSEILKMMNAET